jgi:hypothetical protein
MADTEQKLGDLVGQGAKGGTGLTGAGGASTASGAESGSGIPIGSGGGDTGTNAPGVADKVANNPIEQATIDTEENDEKGDI